ncbi:MAG: hypothetical protein KDN18_03970 [Verrucomicrobiae bacterium]|nr:hypothetical protein [Verrucomicrobiae bacterium]
MKQILQVLLFLLIGFGTADSEDTKPLKFRYWRCDSETISDEDADLILVVEIADIQIITDPILNHFDFGVTAKVVEIRKGKYENPIIGIHIPRQVPLQPYDPVKYGFEKGKRTTIKGKIDDEGKITIHDERVRWR